MDLRPAWRAVLALPTPIILILFLFAISPGNAAAFSLLIVILLPLLPFVYYRRYAHRYVIQKGRIEHQKGVIARRVNFIRVKDIRAINIKQGIIERLLNIGTLEFSSAGGAGIEVAWWGLCHPDAIKNTIEQMHDS